MVVDKHGNAIVAGTPTHPGEVLADELEARGITQRQLAASLSISESMISSLIHGRKSVSVQMAFGLEKALGISADIWLNLQNRYDRTVAYHRVRQSMANLDISAERRESILSIYRTV